MTESTPAEFRGWAIVEIMGHNKVSGFVETKAFGSVVMFRVHAPAVDPVEQLLEVGQYINYKHVPAGSRVRVSRPEFETYVGAASVYRMNPCSEELALSLIPQKIEVIELAEVKQIVATWPDEDDREEDPDPVDGEFL